MLSSDTSDLRAFVSGKRRRVAADPARTRIPISSVRGRFLQPGPRMAKSKGINSKG